MSVLLATPVVEADAGRSPSEILELERKAILAAKTLDEVIQYMPPGYQDKARELPDERKQAALEEWKVHVKPLIYEKLVEGDRGAVLVENPVRDSVEIKVMKRDGERWVVVREIGHVTATASARGTFSTEEADVNVTSALVMQTHINGIPVLSLSNALRNALNEETEVPSVMIPLQSCHEAGVYELSPRSSGT
ncbi:MAG: hypothetical protein KY459_12590 [Acidobacteria bacterium]|nr:hypothetical protein [Acidobacteriota bacterium]